MGVCVRLPLQPLRMNRLPPCTNNVPELLQFQTGDLGSRLVTPQIELLLGVPFLCLLPPQIALIQPPLVAAKFPLFLPSSRPHQSSGVSCLNRGLYRQNQTRRGQDQTRNQTHQPKTTQDNHITLCVTTIKIATYNDVQVAIEMEAGGIEPPSCEPSVSASTCVED